jgi:uncharacterized pyridoxal phosphate-containing UPF0001 family protein
VYYDFNYKINFYKFFFKEDQDIKPQLIAVSKFQPIDRIIRAYEVGQRHFGENYINELSKKANADEILEKCNEIKWHLIGHVQQRNINKLLKIPNLEVIETIDSEKIAFTLNNTWPKLRKIDNSKLNIMIQVNTSNEEGLLRNWLKYIYIYMY